MQYYEFINNKAKPCPNIITDEVTGIYTANPTKAILIGFGYNPKELIISPKPGYNLETQYLSPVYTDGDVITLTWEAGDL